MCLNLNISLCKQKLSFAISPQVQPPAFRADLYKFMMLDHASKEPDYLHTGTPQKRKAESGAISTGVKQHFVRSESACWCI